jgi:hypothetical protein
MAANPTRKEGVMEREVGGELMLYDVTGRAVHVLNESSRFVWQLCDGSHSVDDMVAQATKEYSAPSDQVRADINECLATFQSLGILAQ